MTAGRDQITPVEITESLERFKGDHPSQERTAFIMMQFGSTPAHQEIVDAIRASLGRHGIVGLRADDKDYHDSLFENVLTYMHGCAFGVAVFERLPIFGRDVLMILPTDSSSCFTARKKESSLSSGLPTATRLSRFSVQNSLRANLLT